MKKLVLCLAFMVLLTACGSDSYDTDVYEESIQKDNYYDEGSKDYDVTQTAGEVSFRKIIKEASLNLETKTFDDTIQSIENLAISSNGYISDKNISGSSMYNENEYNERYANITMKVPAEKLDDVIDEISTIGNITNEDQSSQDVTQAYTDITRRLELLQTQEEKLVELLQQANDIETVILLENKIAECRFDIESIQADIRNLDSKIDYSTIHINIDEVSEYVIAQSKPKNFGEKIIDAFRRSFENVVDVIQGIIINSIIYIPALIIQLSFIAVIALIVRKIYLAVKNTEIYKKMQPRPFNSQDNQPK